MADLLTDPRHLRLLEWLTTHPDERAEKGWPDSLTKLAAELDVHPRTMRYWRDQPMFRAAWEKKAKEIEGEPDKVQNAIRALYEMGMNAENSVTSRVKALTEWMKAVEAIKPPAVDSAAARAAELSDEELDKLLTEAATAEAQRRSYTEALEGVE